MRGKVLLRNGSGRCETSEMEGVAASLGLGCSLEGQKWYPYVWLTQFKPLLILWRSKCGCCLAIDPIQPARSSLASTTRASVPPGPGTILEIYICTTTARHTGISQYDHF